MPRLCGVCAAVAVVLAAMTLCGAACHALDFGTGASIAAGLLVALPAGAFARQVGLAVTDVMRDDIF